MAKYIIDIASPNVRNEYIVYWTYDGLEAKRVSDLTPYTDPDLEQVREDAFKNGYDAACKDIDIKSKINAAYRKGMEDAWDAARTLWNTPNRKKIFGHTTFNTVLTTLTAKETIEKIRQYEQEKEEQIQVGDEVENTQTGVKFTVTHLWENNRGEQGVSGFNQECSAFSATLSLVVKTGQHFPEVAAIFDKMRES